MSGPKRAVLAQLPPQRLHLAQRLEPLDDLVEQNLQPLDVDRLGQVVVGAFLHRLDGGLDRALRRQQQRRDVGALLLQRAQQREPVHARHHQVGDDDRRPERRDLLERLFAVARRFGDEAPALDQLLEPDARRGIVFDDQDALGRRPSVLRRRRRFRRSWSIVTQSPQPCHFYILGAERGRCKLNFAGSLRQLNRLADILHQARSQWRLANAIQSSSAMLARTLAAVGLQSDRSAAPRQRAGDPARRGERAIRAPPTRRRTAAAPAAAPRRRRPSASGWREVTIPAGTQLPVVLDTAVGSDTSRVEAAGQRPPVAAG